MPILLEIANIVVGQPISIANQSSLDNNIDNFPSLPHRIPTQSIFAGGSRPLSPLMKYANLFKPNGGINRNNKLNHEMESIPIKKQTILVKFLMSGG